MTGCTWVLIITAAKVWLFYFGRLDFTSFGQFSQYLWTAFWAGPSLHTMILQRHHALFSQYIFRLPIQYILVSQVECLPHRRVNFKDLYPSSICGFFKPHEWSCRYHIKYVSEDSRAHNTVYTVETLLCLQQEPMSCSICCHQQT